MAADNVLVPLSSIDQAGVESSASVFSYVVAGPIDVEALRAAALRVVDKWRLLAGTVEWANKTYNIRVPLGTISDDRLRFTTMSPGTPLGIVFPELSDSSAVTVERPPTTLFRHKDTPNSLSAHAKSAHPIVSIHVVSYTDYTCGCLCRLAFVVIDEFREGIGLNVCHGIMDATGQSMIVRFIDAELHGASLPHRLTPALIPL